MIQNVEANQDNKQKIHKGLIKADQQHNLTSHIKDPILYLSLWPASAVPSWPQATSPPAAAAHPGLKSENPTDTPSPSLPTQ